MSIIRATQKLLKSSRIKPQPAPEINSAKEEVGVWFAQLVSSSFPGKFYVLYVHKPSMICILVPGKTIQSTFQNYNVRLMMLLKRFSYPDPFIDYMLKHTVNPYVVCKTNDRKLLAYMNGLVVYLKDRFYTYDEYDSIDLDLEENLLMTYPYSVGNKSNQHYFTSEDYWNNFFAEKNYLFDRYHGDPKTSVVRLRDGFEDFTKEEKLESENALLKLKLETEFGAKLSDETFGGRRALENQWLNYLYSFEKLHKDAKVISIHEYIGKPHVKGAEELTEVELRRELKKFITKLSRYSINVDFITDYDDLVKYKFITEELLAMQIEDIRMPGLVQNFIYEEFHPNHAFDLRNFTEDFVNDFIEQQLETRFYEGEFAGVVILNGKELTFEEFKDEMNKIVEQLKPSKIRAITIVSEDFEVSEGIGEAKVVGSFVYSRSKITGKLFTQTFELGYKYDQGYWFISAVQLNK